MSLLPSLISSSEEGKRYQRSPGRGSAHWMTCASCPLKTLNRPIESIVCVGLELSCYWLVLFFALDDLVEVRAFLELTIVG